MGYGPSRQMNDGGNHGEKLVNFKLSDAERISNVVSQVEGARRDRMGSTLPRVYAGTSVTFRVATFTGSWPVGTDKDVRLIQETASTLTATNLFFPITDAGRGGKIDCGIAKDGTAWYLISVKHETTEVITSATLGTSSLVFTRTKLQALASTTTSQITIATLDCTAS